MASRSEIRAEQERLKAAGIYQGPVDGVEGPSTRAARESAARDASSAAAKKAESDARNSEALAKAADAEVRRIEAQAKADHDKRAADNAGVDRATQIATNVGAAGLGVGIGHKIAKGIDARNVITVLARNKELKAAGAEARTILAPGLATGKAGVMQMRRLEGVVTTANKLNLGSFKGPRGAIAAGILLTEGAIARFGVAPKLENETAREAVNSVATLSVFAATTLLSERSVANATPAHLPSSKDLTAIETARAVLRNPPASKVKVPAMPTVPPASGSAIGKVLGLGGRGLLRALTPLAAVAAAASMFRSSAEAGENKAVAATKAVAAGADSVLSAGLLTAVVSDPEVQAQVAKQRTQPRGARGSAPAVTAPNAADAAVQAMAGVGFAAGAVGLMLGSYGRSAPVRYGMRGLAVGFGINAAAYVVKTVGELAGFGGQGQQSAPRGHQSSAEDVSAARLAMAQIAGKRSAGEMSVRQTPTGSPPAQSDGRPRSAAVKPASDGYADAYTRVQNGKSVQVSGYHIEPRRS